MNTYEDQKADARQSDSTALEAGKVLFRKRYRQLSIEEIALHDSIKDTAAELAALFYQVAPIHEGPVADREKGANVQIAVRHLEDAVYRAVKGLTA